MDDKNNDLDLNLDFSYIFDDSNLRDLVSTYIHSILTL